MIIAGVAMSQAASDKVVGFYPYWSQYSQFYPKDIRYNTVTDIHYVGLLPAEDGSLAFADENDAENFKTLAQMSKENNVKLFSPGSKRTPIRSIPSRENCATSLNRQEWHCLKMMMARC